jgi:hypothetical protein
VGYRARRMTRLAHHHGHHHPTCIAGSAGRASS